MLSRFFFFISLIVSAANLHAQYFNFENFSLEHGLPQSEVPCLKVDSRGYLWGGTVGGGVFRFDGTRFEVFNEQDGLPSNLISCIEEDSHGDIWIGSVNGVSRFDGRVFSNYTYEDGLIENNAVGIADLKNSGVLIASPSGFSIVNKRNVSQFKSNLLGYSRINKLFKDKQGRIWVLTSNHVFIYNNQSLVDVSNMYKIPGPVTAITQDNTGLIWMAVEGSGLYYLKKNQGDSFEATPYSKNNEIENYKVSSIVFDKRNNLWVTTTDHGLFRFSEHSFNNFSFENGFYATLFVSSCEDHSGNLWFGSSGGGIIKYTPSPFLYFNNVKGLNYPNIFAITLDKTGNIWVGTAGAGLVKFDGKNSTIYTKENGLGSNVIRALFCDSSNILWIGSKTGLFTGRDGKFSEFKLPVEGPISIRNVYGDRKGGIWIGTDGAGAIYLDKNRKATVYNTEKGLSFNFVHSFCEDKTGRVWIGTGGGINTCVNGNIQNFSLGQKLCNEYIGSITEDKYGNIWFGTDRCVINYNGQEFRSYNVADGLTSATVYLLNSDLSGHVWVGTNKGVDKITPTPNGDIASVTNYAYHEGFKGIECNTRSTYRDAEGNLYFGTLKGLTKYIPSMESSEHPKPTLHLAEVKLFSERVNWANLGFKTNDWFHNPINPVFSHKQNHLTFLFDGLHLLSPEKLKFQVMLEGFDKDWKNVETKEAVYTNLKPGDYVFKVRAYVDEVRKNTTIAYPFTIKKAFWQTWWFTILFIVGLSIGVYWIFRLRTRKMVLQNKRLEQQVDIRVSEIKKQKQEIEVLFKEVHHRVKNNLQVINSILNLQSSYITDPDSLEVFNECQNRIYTMSIIHEKLYESDTLSQINLQEYVKRLTEQLNIAYQVKHPFTFDISVNVNYLGLDSLIPFGLLVNEIISNSLKYAFTGNSGNIIKLHLSKNDDGNFRMIIGDNGTGSKVSLEDEHTTFGMELIKVLVDQLSGTITRLDEPGTVYQIDFTDINKNRI